MHGSGSRHVAVAGRRMTSTTEGSTAPEGTAQAPDAAVRASDAERSAMADILRRHAVAGRLDVDELDERIAAALAARTRADLEILAADLPRLPADAPDAGAGDAETPAWAPYFAVMALLVGIWLVSGAGHFWPLYPALGWGIPLLLASRVAGGHSRGCARTG